MILLPVVLAGLVAAGVLAWRYAGPVVGVVVLAIAVYLDFRILRFLRKHLASWVETTPEGLTARLPDQSTLHFAWGEVSSAGLCLRPGSRPFVFLYDGTQDRLLCVPNEYSRFAELREEVQGRIPETIRFDEVHLQKGEEIEDWLKQRIG
jgi:hypothetical protein